MIDNDGSFTYSPIRPVVFDEEIQWQVNPNPSTGLFSLICQATDGDIISVNVYDVTGKLVQQVRQTATGFVQRIQVDLADGKFAGGLYLLDATVGDKKQSFRLLKQ